MVSLQRFEEICRAVPYRKKGMFYSEVFLFLQSCARHRIDTIIESGVKNGMSTALLAASWPGEVISIDKGSVPPDAVIGVDFMHGDSRELIPSIVRESKGRRLAVLIDGPKGSAAVALMYDCLRFPEVLVVGIHDVKRGTALKETWHSHQPEYRRLVGQRLDDLIVDDYRLKYPQGPGLAVWEKPL